ncbi:myosin heavy chain, non-muscle [Fagus crenata]
MSEKNFLDSNSNSDPTEPMDSEHNHAFREPEQSNRYDHDYDHYEVPVELGDSNQEPVHDNGVSEVLGDGGDSEETTEEARRDDMFVDCPDELVSNAQKEAVVAIIAISDRGIGWCISRNRECGAGWLCDG